MESGETELTAATDETKTERAPRRPKTVVTQSEQAGTHRGHSFSTRWNCTEADQRFLRHPMFLPENVYSSKRWRAVRKRIDLHDTAGLLFFTERILSASRPTRL